MAATQQSTLIYPITDFPNDKVNADTLTVEFDNDVAITVDVGSVYKKGSNVYCIFDGLLDGAMIAAADSIVAVHQGEDFTSKVVRENSNPNSNDSTNNWIEKVQLVTGPLEDGWYQIAAYVETRVGVAGAGLEVQAELLATYGDTVDQGNGFSTKHLEDWDSSLFGQAIRIRAGETIDMRLNFRSRGGADAQIRRARLSVVPTFG